MKFKNRVSLITGASQGIGEEIAYCLAEEGSVLVLFDIQKEKLENVSSKINKNGGKAIIFCVDISQLNDVEKAVEKAIEELGKIEEVLKKMEFRKPSNEIWKIYWSSLYNRLERKIGWILFSIGAITLLFWGAYKLIEELLKDPNMPLILKIGILIFIAGAIILLVSILREQLFMRKRERYKEVEK
ncbi:SDR family oxidoreductase [Candidatus Aminicenantes bacterium AH-873-B07]|nr:SDR family oxidoreductase [Candidatus Aminicenantes bacterium AH-873-B07]